MNYIEQFEKIHEIGAKKFPHAWLEANILASGFVVSPTDKEKYLLSKTILSTLNVAQRTKIN